PGNAKTNVRCAGMLGLNLKKDRSLTREHRRRTLCTAGLLHPRPEAVVAQLCVRGGPSSSGGQPLAQRTESGAELFGKQLRLLPTGEVPALVDLVVTDEVRICPLDPALRRQICLARKDAHGDRDGDASGIPKATLVLPIEPRRRNPRVRQPVECDVVKD